MTKNKWLIALIVLVIIVIVVVMSGSSSSSTPSATNSVTKNTIVKNISTGPVSSGTVKGSSQVDTSGAYVVYYTDNGFSPKQSQVPKGHLVKFINNSNKALLVMTDDINSSVHNEINQSKSIGKGGVYTFNFTYTGVWSFHNADNSADHGNIVVY